MIPIENHKRLIMDAWEFLRPNRRRMLEKDWPGLFKQHLLNELSATCTRAFFTDGFDQPNDDTLGLIEDNAVTTFLKELCTLTGALFLQQTMDLNDYDTVRQVAFNIEWHYALDITEENDQATSINETTLCLWRQTLIEHNLDQLMFDNCSDKLTLVFKGNTNGQSIDLVHLKSNIRRLGQISIFNQSINKFLVSKRNHQKIFATVPKQLRDRYATKKALAVYCLVKPSETANTLQQVNEDLHDLVEQFKDEADVCTVQTFKHMQLLYNQQFNVKSVENADKTSINKSKERFCDSLQSPSNIEDTQKIVADIAHSIKEEEGSVAGWSRKRIKKVIFLASAVVIIVGVILLSLSDNGKGAHVNVITVGRGKIMSTLNATGKVVSKEVCRISVSVPGQVKSIYVDVGGKIAKGELMAELDSREQEEQIASAEASLHEAQEKVRQKEEDHKALSKIFSVGGTSKQSVLDAKSSLEMAKYNKDLATATLKQTQRVFDKLYMTAPFEGIVTSRNIHPGERVRVGEVLFILSNPNSREIEIMVDESDGGLVHIGQHIELTSDTFDEYLWQARVVKISPSISKEGTANFIKIHASYGDNSPALKIGQQVDAKIEIANRPDAVKVPFEAIINNGGRTCVAVVKDSVIWYVPIVTGIEDSTSIEILEGISAGQEIILPRGQPIKEGERVEFISKEQSLK